jgi:hypothetical protein
VVSGLQHCQYVRMFNHACYSTVLRTAHSDPGPSRGKVQPQKFNQQDSPEPGVVIIAHNTRVQQLFDDLRVPWGVQYEIARGVSEGRWEWNMISRDMLRCLKPRDPEWANMGTALYVSNVMLSQPRAPVNKASLPLWYVSNSGIYFLLYLTLSSMLGRSWIASKRPSSRIVPVVSVCRVNGVMRRTGTAVASNKLFACSALRPRIPKSPNSS